MNTNNPISNIRVYGIANSFRVAKYPMSADTSKIKTDLDRAKKLAHAKAGSGHDNFLKGIVAQFDLTFSIKAWTEAERYSFFNIVSSQSTMHRITTLSISDTSFDAHTDKRCIEILREKIEKYNLREDKSTNKAKDEYLNILYSVPVGLKLTDCPKLCLDGISTNYQQLKTIYFQRKDHKLKEWQLFCKQLETEFPYFFELIL